MHPQGLAPQEAAKAWYMRVKAKYTWPRVQAECKTIQGKPARDKAVRDAVARVRKAGKRQVPKGRYANCGRCWGSDGEKYKLLPAQQKAVATFVRKWRHKRFCTCDFIIRQMQSIWGSSRLITGSQTGRMCCSCTSTHLRGRAADQRNHWRHKSQQASCKVGKSHRSWSS